MADTALRSPYVQVQNTGKAPLRFAQNSRVTILGPGEKKIVDREAVVALLGDWTLRDHPTDPLRRPRSTEYRRVRGLHGALPGGVYELKDRTPLNPDDLWAERRPHARVVDEAVEVVLVIDDPTGQSLPAQDPADLDRDKLIQHLLAQQAQMADVIARLETESQHAEQAAHIVEDAPEINPGRRRQPAKVEGVDQRDR